VGVTVWDAKHVETIDAAFDRALLAGADQPFLDFSGELFTYGQVAQRVARTAWALRELGVTPGQTVVTMLDNNIDAVTVVLAAVRIGAIAVPVNTAYRGEFLRHQVADAGAAVLIAEADYVERVLAVAAGLPELRHVVRRGGAAGQVDRSGPVVALPELLEVRSAELPAPVARPGDVAMLIYTAGTTGPSKGCMISSNYAMNVARQYLQVVTRCADEPTWTPLPLFHFNAWVCTVLSTTILGGRAGIAPRFSLSGFWPEIERTQARMVSMLGPMANLIANAADTDEMARCRGQLRIAQAAPFTPEDIAIWQQRFGVAVAGVGTYGLTETCIITTYPLERRHPPGSSGRLNDSFDVRIFDDGDRELPAGTAGEIVVRPKRPNVMFEGYWRRPEATAALTRNLWFHTGDIGKFDEEGFFYFVDRKKDYLRRRGENISSFEMENAFLEHPDVSEVAVHAVPSAVTEDDVKVTAVRRDGAALTPEELCRWSLDRLPYFAVPRYIEFRTELPRNPVGRVLKYELRAEGVTPDTWDRELSTLEIVRR
jgi:crotonobetaine/carnitine-CoA ligase